MQAAKAWKLVCSGLSRQSVSPPRIRTHQRCVLPRTIPPSGRGVRGATAQPPRTDATVGKTERRASLLSEGFGDPLRRGYCRCMLDLDVQRSPVEPVVAAVVPSKRVSAQGCRSNLPLLPQSKTHPRCAPPRIDPPNGSHPSAAVQPAPTARGGRNGADDKSFILSLSHWRARPLTLTAGS